ncbi:TauD/TfdA family dioxygenase [Gammaproteobacteria bacterium AS21]
MINSLETCETHLAVTWSSGRQSIYPYIWLRDIDPISFHLQTQERLFDLTKVSIQIKPSDISFDEKGLCLRWPNEQQLSFFSTALLDSYSNNCRLNDPADIAYTLWYNDFEPTRFVGEQLADPVNLLAMLTQLKERGVVIISGLLSEDSGDQLGELIGFKRVTNFGVLFEVINKAEPNNLAYTSVALPLHTDLSNQELPPGYQFLHCLKNEAQGGESLLADGFAIAEQMRTQEQQMYQLLIQAKMPFRFHDSDCDIRFSHPLISEKNGLLTRFIFNAHLAQSMEYDDGFAIEFYTAYQALMIKVRDKKFEMQLKLKSGEMVIFDNTRVLHGRNEFDPQSGERHLRGYYIDKGEVDSKIRMLDKVISN